MNRRDVMKAVAASLGAVAVGVRLSLGETAAPQAVGADFAREPDWTATYLRDIWEPYVVQVTPEQAERAKRLFGRGSRARQYVGRIESLRFGNAEIIGDGADAFAFIDDPEG